MHNFIIKLYISYISVPDYYAMVQLNNLLSAKMARTSTEKILVTHFKASLTTV